MVIFSLIVGCLWAIDIIGLGSLEQGTYGQKCPVHIKTDIDIAAGEADIW
jgi:hypothetical protein